MTILHSAANSEPTSAVRLIGIGYTGMRFVQRFHSDAGNVGIPLAQLQQAVPSFILIEGGEVDALFDYSALGDIHMLLLAFGSDIHPSEIEAAMHLVWAMWGRSGHVIAIVVGGRGTLVPSGDTMIGLLCDAVDARIDVADDKGEEMEPLRWFYLGLSRAILEGGPMLLEAAWDSDDVVETLAFPEVELTLLSEPFESAEQLCAAMSNALEMLDRVDPKRPVEYAQGMLVVIWAPKDYRLNARDVRCVGRQASAAMGAGALHLTIRVSANGKPQAPGMLTLVASYSRPPIDLSPAFC